MSIDQPIPQSSQTSPEAGTKRPRSPTSEPPGSLKKRSSLKGSDTRGFFVAFAENAFRQLSLGKPDDYHAILNVFIPWLRQDLEGDLEATAKAAGTTAEPPARIRAWLDALTHAMPHIDSDDHAVLIETILSMTWTAMDEMCIGPYVRFTAALLGSKPEYIGFVLKRAVKGLQYHTGLRAKAASEITRRMAYDRNHRLLKTLVDTVPTVPSLLLRQLTISFPSNREGKESHVVYFRNVLRTIEYCPAFFDDLLSAVISAALRIDAEIQVEIDEFEDDAGKLDQEVFGAAADPFDKAVQEDVDSESEGEADDLAFSDISSDYEGQIAEEEPQPVIKEKKEEQPLAPEVVARLKELAAKLDGVMSVLFAFLERASKEDISELAEDALEARQEEDKVLSRQRVMRLFDTMSTIFERSILSTFKTRHTQFLMFWMLARDPDFTERFIILLLNKALYDSEDTAIVTRVAALCYLASFISRAGFVDAVSARNVISLLAVHISNHLDTRKVDVYGNKNIVQQHAVFYAAVQASFYIFCFRWRDFVLPKEEGKADGTAVRFIPELEALKRSVISPFNPLRMCSANVATQFARVAHKTEFMYCYSVLEQNKRLDEADAEVKTPSINITPTLAKTVLAPAPLVQQALHEARMDSHFPFDPYKLPMSGVYVAGLYRDWQSPEENDDADDEDEVALGTPENGLPIPVAAGQPQKKPINSVEGTLGSFKAMSLSPLHEPKRETDFKPMSLVL